MHLSESSCKLGVDSSQDMLEEFKKKVGENPNVTLVCMDAVEFSKSTEYAPYDRILFKWMIHLLTKEERLEAFKGYYQQLLPKNGQLLIASSASAEQYFPFDERTKELFRDGKSPEIWINELEQAGFKDIEQDLITFEFPPDTVHAEDWIYIVKNRVWTCLSEENVNEEQIVALINHIKRQYERPDGFKTITKQLIIRCIAK